MNEDQLKTCIAKQDTASEQKSVALASSLGVGTTPTVFVNGAKFEGAVPIQFVFDMVDNALRAEGKVPPSRDPKPDHGAHAGLKLWRTHLVESALCPAATPAMARSSLEEETTAHSSLPLRSSVSRRIPSITPAPRAPRA